MGRPITIKFYPRRMGKSLGGIMGKKLKIRLRLINENDIEWLRETRNKNLGEFFSHDYITPQQQRQWYQSYTDSTGRDYMYIIESPDGTKLGTIALYNINISDRTAELGRVFVIEEYRGLGIMETAINMIMKIAFESMRIFKVRLMTFLNNAAAISLYHKCGFEAMSTPIMLMEMRNSDTDWQKPMRIATIDDMKTYDEMSGGDYESTSATIKEG